MNSKVQFFTDLNAVKLMLYQHFRLSYFVIYIVQFSYLHRSIDASSLNPCLGLPSLWQNRLPTFGKCHWILCSDLFSATLTASMAWTTPKDVHECGLLNSVCDRLEVQGRTPVMLMELRRVFRVDLIFTFCTTTINDVVNNCFAVFL